MSRRAPLMICALLLLGFLGWLMAGGGLARIQDLMEARGPGGVRPWPPEVGRPFPDLALVDLDGRAARISGFRGRVVLLELAAARDPVSQAAAGARRVGPFRDGVVDAAALETRFELSARGVDLGDAGFVHACAVVLSTPEAAATPDDARAWSRHFQLEGASSTAVLAGDATYARADVRALTPGLFLVDRGGVLVASAQGAAAPGGAAQIAARAVALLGGHSGRSMPLTPPRTFGPDDDAGRITAALIAGSYDAADAEARAAHHGGRRAGDWRTRLEVAVERFLEGPRADELLDRWCIHRPSSAFARLFRGERTSARAWRLLGARRASELREAEASSILELLVGARDDLVRAGDLDPTVPHVPASLVTVSLGLGFPESVRKGYLERALEIDPMATLPRVRFARGLAAERGGSDTDVLSYVRRSLVEESDEPALHALVLERYALLGAARERADRARLKEPEARGEIARAGAAILEAYPRADASAEACASLLRDAGDAAAALAVTERAADAGCAWALRARAERILSRRAGEADHALAFRLLRRAAEEGDAAAMAAIARGFQSGQGLPKDDAAAAAWLRAAAERGDAESLRALRLGGG